MNGVLYYNEVGNMKTASRHLKVSEILETWAQLDKNISSDHCVKTTCADFEKNGSEDDIIQNLYMGNNV